jgi:predicted ribonuclease YlaK
MDRLRPVYGRELAVERLADAQLALVVLLGDPGAGKSAVLIAAQPALARKGQ